MAISALSFRPVQLNPAISAWIMGERVYLLNRNNLYTFICDWNDHYSVEYSPDAVIYRRMMHMALLISDYRGELNITKRPSEHQWIPV